MNPFHFSSLVLLSFALFGCGASSTLTCTDSSVSAATLDIAKDQVRDLVLFDALGRHKLLEVALTHPKYDEFRARTDAPYTKEVVVDVDRFLSSKKFSIEAMRAKSSMQDSGSLSCAADFVMQSTDGAKKFPILYSVHPGKDGKIARVEVSGL